jgi:hypothetical protein
MVSVNQNQMLVAEMPPGGVQPIRIRCWLEKCHLMVSANQNKMLVAEMPPDGFSQSEQDPGWRNAI